jgi:hypothetical protein
MPKAPGFAGSTGSGGPRKSWIESIGNPDSRKHFLKEYRILSDYLRKFRDALRNTQTFE